jgi:predicted RND superfamily exporter protein
MNSLRLRIEKGFGAFAEKIFRHRLKTLVLITMVTAALFSQLPKVTLDTSMEGFLHADDPALMSYNEFRSQFGRDEIIIIGFRPDNVFDITFLNTLKNIHREIENNVPHLDDVTSLINARHTRGEGDDLIVEALLETWPRTRDALAAVRQRAMSNQMYRNILLSEDGRFTTILVRTNAASSQSDESEILEGFDEDRSDEEGIPNAGTTYLSDRENTEVVEAVDAIVQKYKARGIKIWLAGTPVVTHFLKWAMIRDMRKFMLLVVTVIALSLFAMFHRVSGILLPLLIVGLSFLSTLSIMALAGTALKIPTQVLPSFILAIAVGTAVHILAIFYQRLEKGETRKSAIAYAMGHSGLAILMANMTTAAGLVSFASADVAPVADLGVFASMGVILSFIYTILLLPALAAIIPFRVRKRSRATQNQVLMDRFLHSVSTIATTYPRVIIAVSAIIIVLAAIGAFQIRFSHYPLKWFKADNIIRQDTEVIDDAMRGSMTIEVVLDTGSENGWHDPDRLKRLDATDAAMEALTHADNYIGKAFSLTTILKEINQALNENREEAFRIPEKRDLTAQEFLLFENSGSDDLEDFVDSQFSKARFTMKFPFKDAVHYRPFQVMIQSYFKKQFPDCQLTFTGMISLLARTISNTITSLAKSYAIAMVIITILMILLIGRLRMGLLSMIPNLAPILMMMGIIGFFHFPMDMFTMMVASIAIGLAVDDTIHFMHNFRRYYEDSGDPNEAVFKTLHTTGRAMLVTTFVLSLGFFIYMFASLNNIVRFGFLTGITLIAALLADYFLAPALMVLVNKKRCVQKEPALAKELGYACSVNQSDGGSKPNV